MAVVPESAFLRPFCHGTGLCRMALASTHPTTVGIMVVEPCVVPQSRQRHGKARPNKPALPLIHPGSRIQQDSAWIPSRGL